MKVKLLKEKNFSLLMIGKFVSLTGTQMQEFALSLYVLKKTGSATLFASVIIMTLIPQLILAPVAGVFTDWFNRKKIIVYLDIISGIIVAAFAVVFITTGGLSMLNIYVLVILLSLSSVMYQPASTTIIPSIIGKEDLVDANGISSLIGNMGNLLAPLVAGILFGFYGLFVILVINAVSFIAASLGEIFINLPITNKIPEKINLKAFRDDFSEGIRFIKERKELLHIIILAPIINFIFTPLFGTGITYVTKKILEVTDFQYGIMQMALVASMMSAPFIASKYAKKYALGKILFFSVFFSSLLVFTMAIVPTPLYLDLFKSSLIPYISIIAICCLVAAIATTTNIALSAMFQRIVPISMMGRVSTVMGTCCMAIAPLGLALFGVLFDIISASLCIAIGAIILLVTILSFRKSLCKPEKNKEYEVPIESKLDVV